MEWIDINEKQPEVGQKVLVFTKWGDIEVSELFPDTYEKYTEVSEGLYKKEEITNLLWNGNFPTHWMPLPKPPNQ